MRANFLLIAVSPALLIGICFLAALAAGVRVEHYFLNGVSRQSEDVLDRAERMNAILESWKDATAKLTPSAGKVVYLLGSNPFLTAKKASENLGIAYNTANRSLLALEKAGILTPTNQAKRDRVFVARELLDILEEPVSFARGK